MPIVTIKRTPQGPVVQKLFYARSKSIAPGEAAYIPKSMEGVFKKCLSAEFVAKKDLDALGLVTVNEEIRERGQNKSDKDE